MGTGLDAEPPGHWYFHCPSREWATAGQGAWTVGSDPGGVMRFPGEGSPGCLAKEQPGEGAGEADGLRSS